MWKIFTKAGQPGWAVIIPFYNVYVLLKIIDRPGWWLILYIIPFVNIIVSFINALDLAKAFGKGPMFGIFGNFLFTFVGYAILGFGSAQYHGPAGGAAPSQPMPPTTPSVTPPAPPAMPTPPTASTPPTV
ncbi:MAG TPA: DUF5684 domain-containing protein [Candidatus Saccharimonadia bacterium]